MFDKRSWAKDLYLHLRDEYTSTIKKAFRHAHSYRGGGSYIQRGRYGGHDISLLELDQPIKSTFACLPSPVFQDQGDGINGMLAGNIEVQSLQKHIPMN